MIELAPELRNHFGGNDAFDSIMEADGRIFRSHKNRRTIRFTKDGKGYFLKTHGGIGWKEILKNLFSLKLPVLGAQNEFRAIRRLGDIGVETMKIAGYGVRGVPPAWLQSFLITEELQGTISLEDLGKEWISSRPGFSVKLALIEKVAEIARLIHRNGMNHRDFYICHFLLDLASMEGEPGKGLRLYLIDLHRMQIRKKTPERWIIKDLAGLFYSSMDAGLSRNDFFRFMKWYSGKSLREIFEADSRFWKKVFVRAVRLYEKDHGTKPVLPNLAI